MYTRKLFLAILIVPAVFFAAIFVFSGPSMAASDTLGASIEQAKSQKPKIDHSTIYGSIAYAKYVGEVIEQDKFADDGIDEQVLGESTSIDEALTQTNVGNFSDINRGTISGSIEFALRIKPDDRSSLAGSIESARATRIP